MILEGHISSKNSEEDNNIRFMISILDPDNLLSQIRETQQPNNFPDNKDLRYVINLNVEKLIIHHCLSFNDVKDSPSMGRFLFI